MTTEAEPVTGGTPRELTLLDQAQLALAEARTVDEVRDVRDRTEAVRAYAQKARLGRSIVVEAAAMRLRAERRLGQLLQTLPMATGAPGNQYVDSESTEDGGQVHLKDIGLSKSDSSRLQRIAMIPEDSFQAYIAACVEANRECTTAGCLRLGKPVRRTTSAKRKTGRRGSPPLQKLIQDGRTFAAIYAAPFDAAGESEDRHEHQHQTHLAGLRDEPVGQLGAEHVHLYLQTSGDLLPEALELMDAWGFRYATCITRSLLLPSTRNHWQPCPKLLVLGFRGPRDTCAPLPEFPVGKEPLAAVHDLIQKISPGPYLDMTSNGTPVNAQWTTIREVL